LHAYNQANAIRKKLNAFTERIWAVCGRSALNAIGPFMPKKAKKTGACGGLDLFLFLCEEG